MKNEECKHTSLFRDYFLVLMMVAIFECSTSKELTNLTESSFISFINNNFKKSSVIIVKKNLKLSLRCLVFFQQK